MDLSFEALWQRREGELLTERRINSPWVCDVNWGVCQKVAACQKRPGGCPRRPLTNEWKTTQNRMNGNNIAQAKTRAWESVSYSFDSRTTLNQQQCSRLIHFLIYCLSSANVALPGFSLAWFALVECWRKSWSGFFSKVKRERKWKIYDSHQQSATAELVLG